MAQKSSRRFQAEVGGTLLAEAQGRRSAQPCRPRILVTLSHLLQALVEVAEKGDEEVTAALEGLQLNDEGFLSSHHVRAKPSPGGFLPECPMVP